MRNPNLQHANTRIREKRDEVANISRRSKVGPEETQSCLDDASEKCGREGKS